MNNTHEIELKTMNNSNQVVLFDLGRVLMHIDFDAFPRGLGLTTNDMRLRFDQTKIQQHVREYETGVVTTDEFLDSLFDIFEKNFSKENILNAFDGIIVKDNQEIIPFIQHVQQQYRIAVLSNTCPSHWDKVLQRSSVIKMFSDVFTSFDLGAMKPDSIVYEKVCRTLNVQSKDVIFIDDLKENIDGAIAVGMKGIIFSNVDQLFYDFTSLMAQKDT